MSSVESRSTISATEVGFDDRHQLVIALDRHETHPWPGHGFSDRLGIDIVALVRLYVGLYILRRHEPHCMPLLLQRPAKKMGSPASFHTDQFDLQIRRKVQQLLARKLLTHHNLAAPVKPNQMKDCLTEINADRV